MLLRTFTRAIIISLMVYLFLIGATYNAVMVPRIQSLTIPVMVFVGVGWLTLRVQGRWKWHSTPLDGVILIWIVAFVVSLLANLEDWRRISIALWYVSLYIAVWYVLFDMIANGILQRETLIDGVLVAGLVLVGLSYIQISNAEYSSQGFMGLPRPPSLLGNPNSFASFLIVLITFGIGRFIGFNNRIVKFVLAVLTSASLFMLFLTFSRGGWVAMAIGLAVTAILVLAHYSLLSPRALRKQFVKQRQLVKIGLVGVILSGFVIAAALAAIFIDSLDTRGREVDYRTYLYTTGIDAFLAKPLTGHGLFTYGKAVEAVQTIHPEYPRHLHNHAHNVIIHVAAELGIFGLIALFATVVVSVKTFYSNWQTGKERPLLIASGGGAATFATHHIFDMTTMLPALALLGLITLLATVAPTDPIQFRSQSRRWIYIAVTGLWVGLLITGAWSANLYNQFVGVVSSVFDEAGFMPERAIFAAEALQPVIDADPQLPPYRIQQANFYGLAANEGNPEALQAAIDAYGQVIELLPNTAMFHANLAALYWQTGKQQEAIVSITQAAQLDPALWQFELIRAQYAETMGDEATARDAYTRMLENKLTDTRLHPALEISPIGRQLTENLQLEKLQQVVVLYEQGQIEEALQIWEDDQSVQMYVMRELLALAQDDETSAREWLERAKQENRKTGNLIYSQWVRFGESRLNGGNDVDLIELMTPNLFNINANYRRGAILTQSHFLRDILPMAYVPQLGYSEIDPTLLRLLTPQQVE